MKAAVLESFGRPLDLRDMPAPVAAPGEAVVDVLATRVLPYMTEVLSGERQYLLDLPQIPGVGAIGRVRELGPDATRLMIGDIVYCDPTIRSRDDALAPDITLQGLSAGGEGGLKLQKHFRHGSFAQQMRVPLENLSRLDIDQASAARWCALGTCLVPFGGLLAIGFRPGETLLVSGATGNFGGAGVAVGLAMGAGLVVAPGRNRNILADLRNRFGARVRTVALTGDVETDCAAMTEAAGPVDCVLDILPPSAPASAARAAIMAVRPNGRVCLMGGVNMQGGPDLALPYNWLMRNNITLRGQWMYPREAPIALAALARAGLLPLDLFETATFGLDEIEAALGHAAANGGPFRQTVITPGA